MKQYTYIVTFINKDGETVVRTVIAPNEFQATQLAGAFNLCVISVVNCDL